MHPIAGQSQDQMFLRGLLESSLSLCTEMSVEFGQESKNSHPDRMPLTLGVPS